MSGSIYPILSLTEGSLIGGEFSAVKCALGHSAGKLFQSSPKGPKITRSGVVPVGSDALEYPRTATFCCLRAVSSANKNTL